MRKLLVLLLLSLIFFACYLIPAIITPKGNPKDIRTLQDLGKDGIKVGIGNPDTVCMGLYAIELLEKNNLLKQVMRNVVVYGGSCSKTANLAALNKVDAIVGWRVLHFWNPDKMDFIPIKKSASENILYPHKYSHLHSGQKGIAEIH